ncbi:polyprenyl synthetase family protein [Streptomyces sp. CT34]|uniref:polyprenyl synthetase family protein n=1 Tax=Streptomyces sp. CT34 TaxID=1553907 RepID=UPI0005B8F938|nr:polyprenyl synthetase family protein [Streptomyces sp. CT34]
MTTTSVEPVAKPLDLPDLRRRVDAVLYRFLQTKAAAAAARNLPGQAAQVLAEFFTTGGMRLRPVLCVLGWQAASGALPPKPVVRVAAAVEMFHACYVIHDDLIARSHTRRGHATVHRTLARQYEAGRPGPLAERLGTACALLIGDLALSWSDELLHTAGLTGRQLAAVLPFMDAMRAEVIHGRYLDVTAAGAPTADLERAMAIIRFKTATYTVERPLRLGAVLGGAREALLRELSAYAIPLGEAFQLRDDLLGVFGDPKVTGKSHVEDLRDGRHTMLVALALRDASPRHAAILRRQIGNPRLTAAEAAQVRDILTVTGARAQVEEMIAERRARVLRLLSSARCIRPVAQPALRRLADTATRRTS